MTNCDWSSDVCSSDLAGEPVLLVPGALAVAEQDYLVHKTPSPIEISGHEDEKGKNETGDRTAGHGHRR
jgi:hypothetical protein